MVVGVLELGPERAADREADVAAGLAALLEPVRERLEVYVRPRQSSRQTYARSGIRRRAPPRLRPRSHRRGVAREELHVVSEIVGYGALAFPTATTE